MDTLTFFRDDVGALRCSQSKPLPPAVAATVGTFDGVHLGHLHLISALREKAKEALLPAMVVTFDRPPVATVRPGHPYAKINDNAEREELLAQSGIDYTVVLPFDCVMANLSAEEFLRDILRNRLHVKLLVSGYDHRLGKKSADGEEPETAKLAEHLGISFFRAKAAQDKQSVDYSSSRIRKLLREGRIEEANSLLGYAYTFKGHIISGNGLGRGLGYPTANLKLEDPRKLIPMNGVYAAKGILPEGIFHGMLYIGNRPTIGGNLDFAIELHLFDFKGDLYGKALQVRIESFVRGERRFADKEALQKQLAQDEAEVRAILGISSK